MVNLIKLQLRASVVLIHYQVFFVIWTFFLEFLGSKKSFKFYIYLIFFSLILFWFFIINAPNVSTGITYLNGILLFGFWISLYFYLYQISRNNDELLFLCYFLFFCISISFLATFFLFNDLVSIRQIRFLFDPLTPGTTTGYINILVMITSVFMFFKKPSFYFFLLFTLIISFIWINRTGVGLCSVLLLYDLITRKILSLRGIFFALLIIIFFIFSFSTIIQSDFISRINDEGLQSMRWIMMLEASTALLNGEYLMGGFESKLPFARPWIHNGFLDLYRVGGIGMLLLGVIFYLMSLYSIFKNKTDFLDRVFLWTISFGIVNTSVAFEGYAFETIFIIVLSANTFFLKKNYKPLN